MRGNGCRRVPHHLTSGRLHSIPFRCITFLHIRLLIPPRAVPPPPESAASFFRLYLSWSLQVVISSIDPRMKTKQSKMTSPEMGEVTHPGGGGYRKGPWTEQEDMKLVWFVRLFGERRWDFLAKVSGLQGGG
ncbi:hypothetical protein ACQ4PT_056732 [Festuca glaucescens]